MTGIDTKLPRNNINACFTFESCVSIISFLLAAFISCKTISAFIIIKGTEIAIAKTISLKISVEKNNLGSNMKINKKPGIIDPKTTRKAEKKVGPLIFSRFIFNMIFLLKVIVFYI